MTKEELVNKLNDIEWEDFEVKEASGGLLNPCGKRLARLPTPPEDGLCSA